MPLAQTPRISSPISLDDMLASVVEQEGVSILAADGVRLMAAPTLVEVTKKKRRRKKVGTGYDTRPAVSIRSGERERDAVADLDRVVVGFATAERTILIRRPVPVRQAEHARSPYVVSLRGLTFVPTFAAEDERISVEALSAFSLPINAPTDIEVVASLASDLCADGDPATCAEQFTPTTFRKSYDGSYGWRARLSAFTSSVGVLIARWTGAFAAPRPAESVSSTEAVVTPKGIFIITRTRMVRTAVSMAALLATAMLPASAVRMARSLQTDRTNAVNAGVLGIADAKAAAGASLPESADALRRASARFREADATLSSVNAVAVGLANLVPQGRTAYRTARALVEIGAKSTDAGALLATGLAAALGPDARSPLDRLQILSAYAAGALPPLEDAATAFNAVDPSFVPEAEREKLVLLEQGISDGRTAVREFTGLAELLSTAMGREEPRRYLVIFQNPSELRPTGGFMGSFAELTMDRGEIKALNVPPGGTYAVQGQLIARVAPPEPLRLINDRWEFQDSNWAPDFSDAAEKIKFFWSKAGGPTVDGVIAVNATLVEKLLVLTGPIDVPELGKTITAENFMLETQKAVEIEYDREENQPKKILGLLAPRLIERLKTLPQESRVAAMGVLSGALETKEIQVSFSDADEDIMARKLGWSGQMKAAPGDALAIVEANVAGQKTDLSVRERVEHNVTISQSGTIENSVAMTRTHTASKGELFRGVRNVSYVRFYVPRGSTLLAAQGFQAPDSSLFDTLQEGLEMDPDEAEVARTRTRHSSGLDVWDEGDRTVFGGWTMVDPGQTNTVAVRYRLPFTAFDLRDRLETGPGGEDEPEGRRAAYSLLLTSQSGKTDREIVSRISVPDAWRTAWGRMADGIEGVWDRDLVSAALYEAPAEAP